MKVNLKYFGVVSEITNSHEELMQIDSQLSTDELRTLLEKKYGKLHNIHYRIAINEQLVHESISLNESDTIAILPPFSGG